MITEDAKHRVSVPLQVSGRDTVRMPDVIYLSGQYTVPVDYVAFGDHSSSGAADVVNDDRADVAHAGRP
jgi:hypothetical protein